MEPSRILLLSIPIQSRPATVFTTPSVELFFNCELHSNARFIAHIIRSVTHSQQRHAVQLHLDSGIGIEGNRTRPPLLVDVHQVARANHSFMCHIITIVDILLM